MVSVSHCSWCDIVWYLKSGGVDLCHVLCRLSTVIVSLAGWNGLPFFIFIIIRTAHNILWVEKVVDSPGKK